MCRKGCSGCCIGISVFPVEWYAVRRHLRQLLRSGHPVDLAPESGCVFLVNGSCSIYPARPLICRVHGLPLIYRVEEYDTLGLPVLDADPEYQLVLCELNFPGMDERAQAAYFTPGTAIDMEVLNEELVLLNREFLGTPEGSAFTRHGRLPLATAAAGLE